MSTSTAIHPHDRSLSISQQVETLLDASFRANTITAKEEILADLVTLHEENQADEAAQDIRHAFLLILKDEPSLLINTTFSVFLAEHIEAEDLLELEWEVLEHIIAFCESLYSFPFNNYELADQVQTHVQNLLRHTLRQLEQRGEQEKMFQLMRLAPAHAMMADAELRRLRHRVYTYEMHRVQRHRRFLYIYLVVQAIFVLVVFPLLFINAENHRLQRLVEELTDVQLGDEGYQPLSYSEAVYWSIITASSIGYGDITPETTTGRIIAAILGTIGVVTVGIFAGLVLDWLSPRRIE